jgi:hypothetical protein
MNQIFQQISAVKVGPKIFIAYKIDVDGKPFKMAVCAEFPGHDPADPEAVFRSDPPLKTSCRSPTAVSGDR